MRHLLLKQLKKAQSVELKESHEGFLDSEASVEDRIIESEFSLEIKGKLKEAFGVLSDRQREAIYLRYQEGLDYESICGHMDINYQSVRNLISTGIKKLSKQLSKEK